MITKIETLKELPYNNYTASLFNSEVDVPKDSEGWLFISKSPKKHPMIILFIAFVEELSDKMSKNE
jgi:hypothetical protein